MSNSIWVVRCAHCTQSFKIPRDVLLSLGNTALCPYCSNSNATQNAILTPTEQVSALKTICLPLPSNSNSSSCAVPKNDALGIQSSSPIERKIAPKKAPLPATGSADQSTLSSSVHSTDTSILPSSPPSTSALASESQAVPVRKIAPKSITALGQHSTDHSSSPDTSIDVHTLFTESLSKSTKDETNVKERLAQKLRQAAFERTTHQLQQQGIEIIHELPNWTRPTPKPIWFYPLVVLQLCIGALLIFALTPNTFLRMPQVYQMAQTVCSTLPCTVPPVEDPLALRLAESRFELLTPQSLRFDFSIENISTTTVKLPALKVSFFDAQGLPIETIVLPTSTWSPMGTILPMQLNNYVVHLKAPAEQIENFKVTLEEQH